MTHPSNPVRKGRTWLDLVRKQFPDASRDDADALLWEATCFPFGTPRQVAAQIAGHRRAGCRTPGECVARAYDQMDRAMRRQRVMEDLRS